MADRKCCQNVKPTLKTVTLTLRNNISKMSQMGMPPSIEHNKHCMQMPEQTGAEVIECAESGTGLELTAVDIDLLYQHVYLYGIDHFVSKENLYLYL